MYVVGGATGAALMRLRARRPAFDARACLFSVYEISCAASSLFLSYYLCDYCVPRCGIFICCTGGVVAYSTFFVAKLAIG